MSASGDVRLEGVAFAYPAASEPAVEEVSLEIPAGQCVIITGPSGCGKTTLTRLINGLVPHVYDGEVRGRVLVGGEDVAAWGAEDLGVRVGSVFQNPRSQFVNLDTTSEIAFGCENLGLPREEIVARVDRATAALGIGSLLGRNVEDLSGGQKQSVIIASALAMEPDVFVMDEPTASLDVESMKRLSQAIAHLKRHGKTVIVSEHRLWWLAEVADRVIRMGGGRILGDWSAEEYGRIPWKERAKAGERAWRVSEMERGCAVAASDASDAQGAPNASDAQDVPAAAEERLRAQGLTVGYRRRPRVLEGAQVTFQAGHVTGLLGKNGAGKTTLLRCLSGLTRESAGDVIIGGAKAPFRKRPGKAHLVMQEPGYQLFADSVRTELLQAARSGNATEQEAEEKADQALQAFGLERLEERHPLSLSGGERQRLAIAAGVLQGARVLLLDEPTSGLDRKNAERVAGVLKERAKAGDAICVVTHDYEFFCAACDETVEAAGGALGPPEAVSAQSLPRVRAVFGF